MNTFKVGQEVIIVDGTDNEWETSGTVKQVVGAELLSSTLKAMADSNLYLVETGSYSFRKMMICSGDDMLVSHGYAHEPSEPETWLNWREEAALEEKAKQMFKALNARGIVGRYHLGENRGLDDLVAAAQKKGQQVNGVAWTNQRSKRRGQNVPLSPAGEHVAISYSVGYGGSEWNREDSDAQQLATRQAVIEEATKVGLYVTLQSYGEFALQVDVRISPRYQHKAVNAPEVYAAWCAEQDAIAAAGH